MRGLDPRIYDAFAAIDGLTNAAGAARHSWIAGVNPGNDSREGARLSSFDFNPL
jgi:hypothetical protein